MDQFFDVLMSFLSSKSIWMYLFIFVGKITEVSISTLRVILISRGERIKGVIAAVFEYTLWLFVTGTVLADFRSDLLKIAVLIVAFAAGNFVGSWLEQKLAFGLCTISIYFKSIESARAMARKLRENGHAVTLMDAEGISEEKREVVVLTIRRKFSHDVVQLINETDPSAMITINDTTMIKGGFLKKPIHRSIGLPHIPFEKIFRKER